MEVIFSFSFFFFFPKSQFSRKCELLKELFLSSQEKALSLRLKRENKIDLMFWAGRSPSCRTEAFGAVSLVVCCTGVCQSEGDRSFSRQGDTQAKKHFYFILFSSPRKEICRKFLLFFSFFFPQIWLFATVERKKKWNKWSLQEHNFSTDRTEEVRYLQNVNFFSHLFLF